MKRETIIKYIKEFTKQNKKWKFIVSGSIDGYVDRFQYHIERYDDKSIGIFIGDELVMIGFTNTGYTFSTHELTSKEVTFLDNHELNIIQKQFTNFKNKKDLHDWIKKNCNKLFKQYWKLLRKYKV